MINLALINLNLNNFNLTNVTRSTCIPQLGHDLNQNQLKLTDTSECRPWSALSREQIPLARYIVSEYCSKGPLSDILKDEKYNLTNDFKFSLSNDIANGLSFLHSKNVVHGHLKSRSVDTGCRVLRQGALGRRVQAARCNTRRIR